MSYPLRPIAGTAECGLLLPKAVVHDWLREAAGPQVRELRAQGRLLRWAFLISGSVDQQHFVRLRFSIRPRAAANHVMAGFKAALSPTLHHWRGVWSDPVPPWSLPRYNKPIWLRCGGESGRRIDHLFMCLDSDIALQMLESYPQSWRQKKTSWLVASYAFYLGQLLPDPAERISGAEQWLNHAASQLKLKRDGMDMFADGARRELRQNPVLKTYLRSLLDGGPVKEPELANLLNPRRRDLQRLAELLRSNEPRFRPGYPRALTVFLTLLHSHYWRWEEDTAKELFLVALLAQLSREGMPAENGASSIEQGA